MWRNRFLAAVQLGSLACAAVGCGPAGRIDLLHPGESNVARDPVRVVLARQVTDPDNFTMRPNEFGAVAVDHARGLLYAGSRQGSLLALDMSTGEIVWELALNGAVGSRPLLTEFPQPPRPPLGEPDVLLVGTDNGEEVAVDLRTHAEIWRYPTDGKLRGTPVVAEGVVYVANSRDQVFALDLRTGAWRWQYEQPLQSDFTVSGYAGLTLVPSSDGVAPGVLYTGFGNGKVVAIDSGTGEALWIASVAPAAGGDFADCDSTPLVDVEAGRLYVAGQSTGVFALAREDGRPIWTFPVRAAGDLVRGAGRDIVGASSLEGIFSLDAQGQLRWRTQVDPGVLSTPVVVRNSVYVGHSERGLLTLDLESGELLGRVDPGSGISGVPAYDPVLERMYVTSNRGVLLGLELLDADPIVNAASSPPPTRTHGQRREGGTRLPDSEA